MKFATKQRETKRCPSCSGRLSDSSPVGPCPACLMQLGLQSWQDNQAAGGHRLDPTIAAPAPSAGTLSMDELADRFPQFELLHLVGSGGMGTVYCARQKSLNRLVALKIIRPEVHQRAEFADRFIREARAMAQLNHSNIITVHDFGQQDDLYYFVMEYVDGINLRQMIRSNRLTAKQALEIVPAVCDALQYAHDRGIVHRDIKPENILIDTNGTVKIADFGLAKLLNQETAGPQLTQANHVMGTMHYMAPEQIEHPLDVDHRADIYSLGVVIYELLTGELPLGRFAPPSHKVTLDVRLDDIVLHTLAKEPALRYQRVGDVKTDMQSVARAPAESPIPSAAGRAAAVPHKPREPADVVADDPWLTGPIPGVGMWLAMLHPQTWVNALYLLLSFPLGIIYFVVLVTGFSTGIGTLVVWIGIFVLLGTFLAVRGFMTLEREMTRGMLRTGVPRVHYRAPGPGQPVLERAKHLAFSGETWTGVLYLLSRFPLGIVSFVVLVTSLSVPLAMLSAPVLWGVFELPMNEGMMTIDSMPEALAVCGVGFLCLPLSTWLINRAAWLNSRWSRLCLRSR